MKCHYDSLSRVGAYRNQTTNEVLAKGPMGLQTHLGPSGVICQVPEYIIGINILESWHNPHIKSLACGVRTIIVKKVKWQTIKFPLSWPSNIASRGAL